MKFWASNGLLVEAFETYQMSHILRTFSFLFLLFFAMVTSMEDDKKVSYRYIKWAYLERKIIRIFYSVHSLIIWHDNVSLQQIKKRPISLNRADFQFSIGEAEMKYFSLMQKLKIYGSQLPS